MRNEKHSYETPDLLIIRFSTDDTIRTSGNGFEIWEEDPQEQKQE